MRGSKPRCKLVSLNAADPIPAKQKFTEAAHHACTLTDVDLIL